MTTDTVDYRFRHCQAKPQAEAARVQSEYGQCELTARERQIYEHLGYLDPQLAHNLGEPGERDCGGRVKPLPRRADDYKRKGG